MPGTHEIGSWNRQAKRACGESLLEGVPRVARVILQHTQQQRAEMAYWEAKRRMGKDKGERRVGREQNRTGHLKHELPLQVRPLFSQSHHSRIEKYLSVLDHNLFHVT